MSGEATFKLTMPVKLICEYVGETCGKNGIYCNKLCAWVDIKSCVGQCPEPGKKIEPLGNAEEGKGIVN